ncbi:MAG: helix-turn-helix domain-containing protein [Synergistaceae bacterium]|nr:helix-turn-helix domain-containing protein [Synergistaceae bacterium]
MSNSQEFYLINAFADIVGIAAQNLRRLDRRGVFKPHHVDEKGRRYYSREQIAEVEKIRDKINPRKITPPVELRERLGYGRKDISKVVGCGIENYERGITNPSLEFIEDLTKIYEVPFAEVQTAFDAVRKPSTRKTDFENAKAEVMPNRWDKETMTEPMRIRNEAGFTRPFVCDLLDLTEHTLFGYEKGDIPVTLEVIEALTKIYDVSFIVLQKAFDSLRDSQEGKKNFNNIIAVQSQGVSTPAELRFQSKLTANQISEALEITLAALTRYENGSWPVPLKVAEDMAALYNISINEIRKIFAPLSKMPELEDVKYLDRVSIWEKSITQPMALRQRIGFSRQQVYKFIGVGHAALTRYEKGESEIPLDVAEDLAKLYNVTIDEIRKVFASVRRPRQRKPNFDLLTNIRRKDFKKLTEEFRQKYKQTTNNDF